jgi:hypothetical protein
MRQHVEQSTSPPHISRRTKGESYLTFSMFTYIPSFVSLVTLKLATILEVKIIVL